MNDTKSCKEHDLLFCLISKSISLKSVEGHNLCNEIRGFHLEEAFGETRPFKSGILCLAKSIRGDFDFG